MQLSEQVSNSLMQVLDEISGTDIRLKEASGQLKTAKEQEKECMVTMGQKLVQFRREMDSAGEKRFTETQTAQVYTASDDLLRARSKVEEFKAKVAGLKSERETQQAEVLRILQDAKENGGDQAQPTLFQPPAAPDAPAPETPSPSPTSDQPPFVSNNSPQESVPACSTSAS